jgi:hypothetical protein
MPNVNEAPCGAPFTCSDCVCPYEGLTQIACAVTVTVLLLVRFELTVTLYVQTVALVAVLEVGATFVRWLAPPVVL